MTRTLNVLDKEIWEAVVKWSTYEHMLPSWCFRWLWWLIACCKALFQRYEFGQSYTDHWKFIQKLANYHWSINIYHHNFGLVFILYFNKWCVFKWKLRHWKHKRKVQYQFNFYSLCCMCNILLFILKAMMWNVKVHMDYIFQLEFLNCHSNSKITGSWKSRVSHVIHYIHNDCSLI